jgi:ubiquitin carboxyl-terminal hydrolase 4/11/15
LGHEGKLAESFGNLIQLMWGSNGQPASAVSPKGFKYQMGRFRPEFQGYQQHDSSELMNFLLDGLHEDLNRIIDKPYTEAVENDGTKPDNEMAQVFLEQHMKRNDSFIHDLFRGQFKSTLVCPCCGNVSVTFDPYTMVSLPLTTLEQERMTSYHVTVWSQAKASDGSKCPGRTKQNIKVSIVKGSKALALMEAVAEATNIDIKRLVFTQVMRGYVYKIFEKAASLDYLNNSSKLYAHEVEEAQPFNFDDYSYLSYGRTPKAESIYSAVTCLFRYQEEESVNYYLTKSTRVIPKLFGEPMLLCHPKETNPKALYAAVARAMSPMVEVDGVQKQLVLPEHINIFVSKDIYASQNKVDSHPVDRLDSQAIDQGMHAKLTLVIEFEQDFIDRVMFNTSKNEVMKIPGIPVHTLRKGGGSSEVEEESKGAAEDDDEEEEDDNTDKTMKIDDCFELFETPEKLSVEDSWYCGKCKDHVQASKTMELWSTPEVLVLHLKRFSYSRWSRDKLETPVSFPLDNLDMSRFMKGPSTGDCIYDCVAVSNHMGSLGGGHYTACARGADNKWYSFNDSHTGEVHASRVNSSNVYLLFYVKRTTLAKTEIANDKQADVVSSGAGGGGAAMLD